MPPTELKTFIDLFAGIGGFHLALRERGLECVFASEWDKHAAWAYEQNYGMKPAGDITKIEAEDIPPMDVICGGFPCQAFSLANNSAKGMEEARGTLFFDICRIAKHHQPKMMILENVPRILSFDDGKVLETIYRTLDEIGYKTTHHLLNAALYGVATARRRVYFVAIRKDLDWVSNCPEPTYERACVADHLRHDLDTKHLERPIEDFVFREHKQMPGNPEGTKLLGRHKNVKGFSAMGRRVYDVKGALPAMTCGDREKVLVPESKAGQLKLLGMRKNASGPQGNRVYDPNGALPTMVSSNKEHVLAKKVIGHRKGIGWKANNEVLDPDFAAQTFNAHGGGTFGQTGGYLVPKQAGKHRTRGDKQGYKVYFTNRPGPAITARGGGTFCQGEGYFVPRQVARGKNSQFSTGPMSKRVYASDHPAPTFNCDPRTQAGKYLVPEKGFGKPKQVCVSRKNPGSIGYRGYDISGPAVTFQAEAGGMFVKTGGYFIPELVADYHKHKGKQGCRVYGEKAPANTLMTSNGKNDNFHIQGVVRRLHVEEAKTIQGFPATHILSKGDQGYRQIGNSVIPKMVGLVFDNIVPAEQAQGQAELV